MFQGVPYLVSVLLAGLLIGAILAPSLHSRSNSEIARRFYLLTAVLLGASVTVNAWMMLGDSPKVSPITAKVAGSLLSALFASIFGIAVRRRDTSQLLGQPEVLDAIRMTVALISHSPVLGRRSMRHS